MSFPSRPAQAQENQLSTGRQAANEQSQPAFQATSEPEYLNGQVVLDTSVDLPKCFVGYINSGMVPCGAPAGTEPQHIDIVWPQTIQYYEFSLASDAWLAFEIHKVIDDAYPGGLGVSLYAWDDAQGDWVPIQYYWSTGTLNDHGNISGNFDPDWASKVAYDPNREIYPAGRYRVMAWAALRYDGWGAVYGYIPSKGSIRIYAFENIPPPTATPSATPDAVGANAEGVEIRVRVEAAGYESIETAYYTDGYDPSSIEIWGTVSDQYGNAIENATVSLIDLQETAVTTWVGSYHLNVPTIGTQPWSHELNWTLTPLGANPSATPRPITIFQPTPTPTPAPADLSLENGVHLLQAIEGANFVAARDIGVLVRPFWSGSYPENISTGYQFQVTLTYDGTSLPPVIKGPGRDFTWVIPAGAVSAGEHTISVQVELVGAQIVDTNPANNRNSQTITAQASQPLRLLFVRVQPKNAPAPGINEFTQLVRESIQYLQQVYPVHTVQRVPSSYLVWTATDTRLDVSLAVAKTLVQYNNNRCLEYLPDGRVQPKANCDVPRADLAIGVVPTNYYGTDQGWLFGRGASIWGVWKDKLTLGIGWLASGGASLDRAAITVVSNPLNPAHEIGHHFDLNDEYGDSLGKQILYGFIWKDGQFIQVASESREYYNFMGNAGVGWPATQYWVDVQTWNHLLNQITAAGQASQPRAVASLQAEPIFSTVTETYGPALMVSGQIDHAGQAQIHSVDPLYRHEILNNDQGSWTLEAVDSSGGILGTVRFDPYPAELNTTVPFLAILPVSEHAAVNQIRLRQAENVVTSLERSANAPILSIVSLPDPNLPATTLSWQVSDPDGDATTTTVFYTVDAGSSWQVLVQDTREQSVQFEPASLPGGEVQFRLVTSDGFNQASFLPDPILMPEHNPEVWIETPLGSEFMDGDAVILKGVGEDVEDGNLSANQLEWFDADNQSLGLGSLLHIQLPVGEHSLTLLGRDSDGMTQTANLNVIVRAVPSNGILAGDVPWLLLVGGVLFLMLAGGLIFVLMLTWIMKRQSKPAPAWRAGPGTAAGSSYQDDQGQWWYQDPAAGTMYFWNGSAWQPAAPARPSAPGQYITPTRADRSGPGSCLGALAISVTMALLVFGGVSLVAWNFFPGYSIQPAANVTIQDLLLNLGGGALLALLGTLMLRSGFKAISTRRAMVEDEWGRRREQRGCAAVMNGLWQVTFGLGLLIAGLLILMVAVYRQFLPWLGL